VDTQVENFLLNTSNDQSSAIWKLTRAMKQAGYRYRASSDGTTQDSTGNPNNDKWGLGIIVGAQTATVAFTIGAPTTTSYGGRSTITGLTGFTAASAGHFLKIVGATNAANVGTWLITQYISATSVIIENPAAIAETTPGTATWTELSSLLDTFPALGVGAWWLCQGPSTMKIPLGATSPTGTFQRGENVTQATSGATGEVLGVVTYSGGGGYMVIAPRASGTGGGPRGWSTNTITGTLSGATVTPTATAIEFVREIVFWRASTTTGHIYYQVIDQASEATPSAVGYGRFSAMTGVATTVVCPGGAATGNPVTNGFPTYGSYVPLGTGGSGLSTTGPSTWGDVTAVNLGKCQFLVANCIEDVGISPDGTLTFAMGTPSVGTYAFQGWFFSRLDDTEDGDVDPYIWYFPTPGGASSRTVAVHGFNTGNNFHTGAVVAGTPMTGWVRRGYANGAGTGTTLANGSNGDAFSVFHACMIGTFGGLAINTTIATADTVACAVASTRVRDPIWIAYAGAVGTYMGKVRKGSLRWHFVVSGNAGCDTYDGKRWIQLGSGALPLGTQALVAGPADGSTVPVNQ
jgi:hypothetical protein